MMELGVDVLKRFPGRGAGGAGAPRRPPYRLVVGSHKGGTAQTTTALALAWTWAQAGLEVTLLDADPVGAAGLIAAGKAGCPWSNVRLISGTHDDDRLSPSTDLVIVDSPALTDPAARGVLREADGVVLTILADPLSLRTVPSAVRSMAEARAANPRLVLLGLLVAAFDDRDPLQAETLALLRADHADVLLDPPIPYRPEVRDWALRPGSDLPDGPGRSAYGAIARRISEVIGLEAARS